jgi:hypothetical protein
MVAMFHLRSDLAGIFGNVANEKFSIEGIAAPLAADLHPQQSPILKSMCPVEPAALAEKKLLPSSSVVGIGSYHYNRSRLGAAILPESVSTHSVGRTVYWLGFIIWINLNDSMCWAKT